MIPGLGSQCFGLVACIHNNCLYASDCNNHVIHRVDLSGSNAVVKWFVGRDPAGLSVNKAHNVVVMCCKANKLQEYTTCGSLVRQINLQQAGLFKPWHAVQLSTGDYAVSQDTSPGVVSVVGLDGQVVCSYDQASDLGPVDYPGSLVVTKNDEVIVADDDNCRILSLSSSLSSGQVLAMPVDIRIEYPCGLCFDEPRGRLYVSEHNGSRVFVFESMATKC